MERSYKKMKKIVSVITAMLVTVAFTVPVFAAPSPSTASVINRPVSASHQVAEAKGYSVTDEEAAAVATTLEEAVALSATAVVDPSAGVLNLATSPEIIAMAKLDILKNPLLLSTVIRNGLTGRIVSSAMLTLPNGAAGVKNVNLTVAGTAPGQKVLILYYLPGDPTPRYVAATVRRNGKIRVKLPVPCEYNIVR